MKATIIDKTILSKKWADFSEYTIAYERTDGAKEIQKREILHTGDGAAILLYNLEKREVLLIRQYRLASMLNKNESGILWEAPAGLVEKDDPHYTILKEVKEETGLILHNAEFLFKGYATPGVKTEMIHFFSAAYNDQTPIQDAGGVREEQEDIEVKIIDFDLALEMVFSGEIIDLKTITLLLFANQSIFRTN